MWRQQKNLCKSKLRTSFQYIIKTKNSNNIYIHIDLDVLDIKEFPYVIVIATTRHTECVVLMTKCGLKGKLDDIITIYSGSKTENEQKQDRKLRFLALFFGIS